MSYCNIIMFHNLSFLLTSCQHQNNRREKFKKYAIVSKKNSYICSINMPYYALTASSMIYNYKTDTL